MSENSNNAQQRGPGDRAPTVSQLRSSFAEIQGELKRALDGIHGGQILASFEILSKVTDAVVVSCESLGLASELPVVETFHRDNFWRALNQCWLVALQNVSAAQSDSDRLREEHLVHLRDSVVKWGDALEKYGLVDYEMGFWESDIVDMLDNVLKSVRVAAAVADGCLLGQEEEAEAEAAAAAAANTTTTPTSSGATDQS